MKVIKQENIDDALLATEIKHFKQGINDFLSGLYDRELLMKGNIQFSAALGKKILPFEDILANITSEKDKRTIIENCLKAMSLDPKSRIEALTVIRRDKEQLGQLFKIVFGGVDIRIETLIRLFDRLVLNTNDYGITKIFSRISEESLPSKTGNYTGTYKLDSLQSGIPTWALTVGTKGIYVTGQGITTKGHRGASSKNAIRKFGEGKTLTHYLF